MYLTCLFRKDTPSTSLAHDVRRNRNTYTVLYYIHVLLQDYSRHRLEFG